MPNPTILQYGSIGIPEAMFNEEASQKRKGKLALATMQVSKIKAPTSRKRERTNYNGLIREKLLKI